MAESSNQAVFSPPTLMLGEIHWHLLHANDLLDEKTSVATKRGGLVIYEGSTDFGKAFGRDEINWWVFKKEPDIAELKDQADRALEAAQKLKKSSELLKSKKPKTHEELLKILREFAEQHAAEIDILRRFVCWLAARDPLAPTILWTYRVWGSTRRGDRHSTLDLSEVQPKLETIKTLTEIVLGLSSNGLPAMFRAEYEIGADMYESIDPEQVSEIKVPMDRIVRLASSIAFDKCAEYFEFIRDSLRNILLEIGKFMEQRDFVNDDVFWRAFIVKVSQTTKVEPLLWDCKETLTMWHTKTDPARNAAKVTFCEDVASFANAHGGVLIVGVTDKREIVGVGGGKDLENRLKDAADALAKHLEYPREIFRFRQVVVQGKDGQDKICLVVVIAQACEDVGVNDGAGHYSYPVRRETGVTRVSREEIFKPKMHMKSDNYDFLREIYKFIQEK